MKSYKTLIAIRGLHTAGDIPEGAVITLSATQLKDLHGLVEETDEEATFALGQFSEAAIGLIAANDKAALAEALTALGAIVILPHDDGSFDLSDLPQTALLAGVLAKIETGELQINSLSVLINDEQALADMTWRLGEGLDPARVAALLPPPPDTDATGESEQAGADDAPPAKKSPKKAATQE